MSARVRIGLAAGMGLAALPALLGLVVWRQMTTTGLGCPDGMLCALVVPHTYHAHPLRAVSLWALALAVAAATTACAVAARRFSAPASG